MSLLKNLTVKRSQYFQYTTNIRFFDSYNHPVSEQATRISSSKEAAIATRRKTLRHFRQEDVTQFAVKKIERLETYKLIGRWPPNEQQLIQTADWLHKNIPIRVAHIIYRFRRLPFEIGCNEHVQEAHEQYISSFTKLRTIKTIKERSPRDTWNNVLELTDLLDTLLLDHQKVLPLLVTGFRETAVKFNDDASPDVVSQESRENPHQKANRFLDTILKERLCIRLLCDHHVKVLKRYQNEQNAGKLEMKGGKHVGIFDRQFDPCELVEKVFTDLEDVCNAQYGTCPELSIKFKDNFVETDEMTDMNKNWMDRSVNKMETFKYISWPLEYILKEVIKNAMRAQVKTQIDERTLMPIPGAKQYPIKVLVVQNEEGFDIRISDRGGGIKNSSLKNIWEYNFSSVDGKEEEQDFYSMVNNQGDTKRMFGYGCGLPISKVYCETLGGNLSLQSISSYGTDVFIKLPFLPNQSLKNTKTVQKPIKL